MKRSWFVSLSLAIVWISGCGKILPQVGELVGPSPLTFNGSRNANYTIHLVGETVAVSGECGTFTTGLEVSLDGGSLWTSAQTLPGISAATVSCSQSGRFQFDIQTGHSNFGFTTGTSATKTLLLRALTAYGSGPQSSFTIQYQYSISPLARLSAGSGVVKTDQVTVKYRLGVGSPSTAKGSIVQSRVRVQ
jgi:hypothetical protein